MFIGNFRAVGDNFTGVIKTLTFVLEAIEKKSEKAPDYRVATGGTDIGVACNPAGNLSPHANEGTCRTAASHGPAA